MSASQKTSHTSIGVSCVQSDQVDVSRLLVLAPDRGFDTTRLARIIWNLAAPCSLPVLYLSLGGEESGVRLRMITLASMTRDAHVQVDILVTSGTNWVRAVKDVLHPGDLVLCFGDQLVRVQGLGVRPLYDVLETALHVRVYVVPILSAAPEHIPNTSDGIAQLVTSHLRQVLLFSVCSLVFIAQLPEIRLMLTHFITFCSAVLRVALIR